MRIEASNFCIRTWERDDSVSLQKHANNPGISRYLLDRFPYPYTLADAEFFIRTKLEQQTPVNFAIEINGEVAGGIGLEMRHDVYRQTPLLGYWLSEEYWGRGIVVEAINLITSYAFEHLGAICIVAYVLSKNPNSMRALEKSGYRRQGIITQSVIKNQEVMDEYIYAKHAPGNTGRQPLTADS